jgi:NAD(P)H-hydrate epimerase
MAREILSVEECYAADRSAAAHGITSLDLMESAGRAVAGEILKRFEQCHTLVLCGPGNNGGDGYVVARHLKLAGWRVRVAHLGTLDALKGDAAQMAKRWDGATQPIEPDVLGDADLVVVALFGAGLSRPIEGVAYGVIEALNSSRVPVVAVDVPSGLHGDLARPLGDVCVDADLTVTFFRKKRAHVLMPGRSFCGEVVVADIGIPANALDALAPNVFENSADLWTVPALAPDAHKYSRGHCVVLSGPLHATGAARLAARGALRAGAGLVSVASQGDAVAINAAHLTAIMVKPFAGVTGFAKLLSDRRLNAVVLGPGAGTGGSTRDLVAAALATQASIVLDADALTAFAAEPNALFLQLREPAVLTPHEGEFERLFPGLLSRSPTRIEAVRAAAAAAHCTVLLKGADTAIASPGGQVIVNTHAPPTLATAGSGDVLAGIIGGLMAQGLDSWSAAASAAWLHGEAAFRFGPGLISEDLPDLLPAVFSALAEHKDERHRHSDRRSR